MAVFYSAMFVAIAVCMYFFLFFFNAPATPEIYTLSLHDALPIFELDSVANNGDAGFRHTSAFHGEPFVRFIGDRKSTRLNSSHRCISYAVFCLKKKNKKIPHSHRVATKKSVRSHQSTSIKMTLPP